MVEIGAGTGVLTERLVKTRARRIVALELDPRMEPGLRILAALYPALQLVMGDVLALPWGALGLDEGPVKVVGNLPYYITTPILQRLIQADSLAREPLASVPPLAARIVLMVQQEVADRMGAPPGGKSYGSLSVLVQYACAVERVLSVPRSAFSPRPQVDSAVVALVPRRDAIVDVAVPATFFRVVRGAFGQRRKTLQNALLAAGFLREPLRAAAISCDIDVGRRGETLSLGEFACLANGLS